MGFAAQSRAVFVPSATVLPAVFVLGLFTVVRLVDALVEYNRFWPAARVREQYRVLSPEAAAFFAAEHGRWPEEGGTPALGLGAFIAFITTTASMVAFVNSVVAGAGIALLGSCSCASGRVLLWPSVPSRPRSPDGGVPRLALAPRHGVRHPRQSGKHALDRGLPLWGPSSAASCSYNHRYRSVPIPYRRRSPQPVEIVRSTPGHWPR